MNDTDFKIRLPEDVHYHAAGEEYFFLTQNGQEKKVMLQDYKTLYSIPGFYERLAYDYLNYKSPSVLFSMLKEQLKHNNMPASGLNVLEIGAGSGLMGKKLKALGVASITAIDIIEDAAAAAQRDYPGVYETYYVEDMTDLSESTTNRLKNSNFNCLVCCSALSHIPADAFTGIFNLVSPESQVAFNILTTDWEDKSANGFTSRHPWVKSPEIFQLYDQQSYLHRTRTNGSAIDYVALTGIKKNQIP